MTYWRVNVNAGQKTYIVEADTAVDAAPIAGNQWREDPTVSARQRRKGIYDVRVTAAHFGEVRDQLAVPATRNDDGTFSADENLGEILAGMIERGEVPKSQVIAAPRSPEPNPPPSAESAVPLTCRYCGARLVHNEGHSGRYRYSTRFDGSDIFGSGSECSQNERGHEPAQIDSSGANDG